MLSNDYFNKMVVRPNNPETPRSQLFVGTQCNYDCQFCYYSTKLNIKNNSEEVFKQMDFVQGYGIKDIEFTGGEPTIDPRWFDYLKYASINFRHICVISSGTKFWDKEFTLKSKERGLREILFSLHGYDKESHERITRRKGSWDKIISSIENAKELGLIVRINITVCNLNYKGLEKHAILVNKIQPTGINYIALNYWQDTVYSETTVPYKDMASNIKKAIDTLENIPFINVRYIPYCFMVGYEQYVCNWYQHCYDPWDWNNALKVLPSRAVLKDSWEFASIMRKNVYGKSNNCLRCKYVAICDGIEKELIPFNEVMPHSGKVIVDPNYFRKDYCSKEQYEGYVCSK